jgi:alkanesulfonate monooxygenase SsuD/methylene tetrahydromethanopterin reductase-like flavin-dependent oxidoreductase (luciferase family)
MRGTGLVLRDPLPWADLREMAETAEETGYAAVFVPEIAGREAFSTLTGLATATSSVVIGTGVIPMTSRTPTATAMAASTVQDVSGGRLVVGLGTGTVPSAAPGPVERLREYVRVVRAALRSEMVDSPLFGVEGFALELGVDPPPPVWLAALGDRMVELGGEIADGVLLNWCTPERVQRARRAVMTSAEGAGRDPASVTVAVYVRACIGPPAGVARRTLKEMTGRYASLPKYLAQFERMGLGNEAPAAARAFAEGRPDEVPDHLVDALCVSGSRDAWLARAASYRDAGADLVFCYPVAALDAFSSVLGTVLAAAPAPAVER